MLWVRWARQRCASGVETRAFVRCAQVIRTCVPRRQDGGLSGRREYHLGSSGSTWYQWASDNFKQRLNAAGEGCSVAARARAAVEAAAGIR